MTPASSVSGFYIANPQSMYFNVGKVGSDQLEDLAKRSGQPLSDIQRSLGWGLAKRPKQSAHYFFVLALKAQETGMLVFPRDPFCYPDFLNRYYCDLAW